MALHSVATIAFVVYALTARTAAKISAKRTDDCSGAVWNAVVEA